MYGKRKSNIGVKKSVALFKKTANRTNVRNIPSKYAMRGGFHF